MSLHKLQIFHFPPFILSEKRKTIEKHEKAVLGMEMFIALIKKLRSLWLNILQ